MCIAAWIWRAHPLYPLILLFNRDELINRPTDKAGWWVFGTKEILGGRDAQAGGTWMGCTKDGRVAFLTNVMEPHSAPNAKSRGDLPLRFLESGMSTLEYAEMVMVEADQYNGFNLILADLYSQTMVYISNRPKEQPVTIQLVSPGLHVLTNARLDTPWPKALRLSRNFRKMLHEYRESVIPVKHLVKELMNDNIRANKDRLPNTGCDTDFEMKMSSIFVEADTIFGRYLTRSQAALVIRSSGEASLYERYLEKNKWEEQTIDYQIKNIEAYKT